MPQTPTNKALALALLPLLPQLSLVVRWSGGPVVRWVVAGEELELNRRQEIIG